MAFYYRLAYYRLAHYVGHKPMALGLRVPCSISDGQISNLNNIVSERLVQVWVAGNEQPPTTGGDKMTLASHCNPIR